MVAKFLAAVGVLTVALIFSFGWSLFGTEGPRAAESNAMGLFVLLVLGVPAVAFGALLFFGAAAVFAVTSPKRPPAASATAMDAPTPRPRDPPEVLPKTRSVLLTLLSALCFVGAVLWSVPFGFLTFVGLVTSDLNTFIGMGGRWLLVAMPLLTISVWLRRV